MSILEPAPVVRQRCERCLGDHPHRWVVTFERPAEAWSECTGCSGITIWRHGCIERPLAAAGARVPRNAILALTSAASRERSEALGALDRLRGELDQAESRLSRVTAFIERFNDYQRQIDPGGDGCGENADNLCAPGQDGGASTA